MKLSQIHKNADRRLQEDGGRFSKLVLIHTAITASVSLLFMLISWASNHITPEGGLSNMDTQNLLSTGQILLRLIIMIASPIWEAGLIFCALQLLRNGQCTPSCLPEGFRHWSPVISSMVIRGVIYFAISIACYFASSMIISLLPLPTSVIADLTAFMETPTLPLSAGVRTFMILLFLIYIATLCILLIPKVYLHRLVVYRIMDDKPCGGLQAVLHSRILMKGHRRKLFSLDLSFWWFYLLEFGISILSVGYLFLPAMGIALPINEEVAVWVFPLSALLAQLVLYGFVKPKLAISYALFYQQIYEESPKGQETVQPKQTP